MTRTGDREIRSVSGRLPDNPGELAYMCVCVYACVPCVLDGGGGVEGEKQTQICLFIFCMSPKLKDNNVQNKME